MTWEVMRIQRDVYTNGEPCILVTDERRPGCVAYGPDVGTAIRRMNAVRAAWDALPRDEANPILPYPPTWTR